MVMQIACVLRSGGEFSVEHVRRLVDSIRQHNDDLPIVCLSDIEFDIEGVEVKPLRHNWPGWWSKIELFRGDLDSPTLYLDLDTVVVGRLPVISGFFTMLDNVYKPGDVGSGVMSWAESPTWIYETFRHHPDYFIETYKTSKRWGDQGFIRDYIDGPILRFGQEYRSYKAHCKSGVPIGTSVVYFHGSPRPWEVNLCA